MKRDLARLSNERFDLVILGGGVYGLSAAWDASLRGLKVALLEKNDFGQATSSGTLKLIHGGLRYLQHLNFARMRISIGERRTLLRIAPHLVHPLEFVIPCYGHGMKGPEAMRMALLANDLMSFDRNRGLDPLQRIPAGRMISAGECLERIPGLRAEGLTAGAVFHDGQMYSSERLTLAFGLAAAEEGAALANYVEAVGFRTEASRILAVRARDVISGRLIEVAGALFLNMTGPWSDITIGLLRSSGPERQVLRSKGIQLFTRPLPPRVAFPIESRQRDAAALIRRGGRNYFVTPWRDGSILGTTDTLFKGDPDGFAVTEEDIADFLREIKELYPASLGRGDVRFWMGGLRPLGDEDTNPEIAKASHRAWIREHGREGGPDNLWSVVGIKYTVCRHMAERALDRLLARWPHAVAPCRTARTPLPGGDLGDLTAFLLSAEKDHGFTAPVARRLAFLYGARMNDVLSIARAEPGMAAPVAGSSEVLRAQVAHAVREEMAIRLSDAVLRRTDLGSFGHPGAAALEDAAGIMARELGWPPDRQRNELEQAERAFVAAPAASA